MSAGVTRSHEMASLLVVDDDGDLADVFADFLGALGHEVRIARNGQEGLVMLHERLPHLVVLDIEMPVMSGSEMALRVLLQDAGMETVPILLSSGMPDLEHIAETIGTPYYINKPWQPDDLAALIARALAERQPPRPHPTP